MRLPDRLAVLLFVLRACVAAGLFLVTYAAVRALGMSAGQLEVLIAVFWAMSFAPFITAGRDNLSRRDEVR